MKYYKKLLKRLESERQNFTEDEINMLEHDNPDLYLLLTEKSEKKKMVLLKKLIESELLENVLTGSGA